MNIALWIVQALLAAMFLMAGMMKTAQYEKAKAGMPWVKDYSKAFVNFIGWAELLGAVGLILPYAIDVAPALTAVAAIALAVIMLFAAVFHGKRGESQSVVMNVVVLALLVFVAIGRF